MAASTEKLFYATGRRKTSTARVFLKPGKGVVTVNGKKLDEFMSRLQSRMVVMQPMELLQQTGKFDANVTVDGGGEAGQAGAIRLGMARALQTYNPDFRPTLKKAGYLTRDQRMVERKKYGKSGARRRYQYSKR